MGIGGEYYTSQPQFCGSCHIMDPYYVSWERDVHAQTAGAACVDCHYAPGTQHTFMAKFRGLSQLTSYFSGRAGAGRPKAQVDNASCLTSECHGDQKFMTAELRIGNAHFVHAKHLDPDSPLLTEKRKALADLRSKLSRQLEAKELTEVKRIAEVVRHADERNQELTVWLADHERSELQDDVLAWAELLHTELRIDHLGGLKCGSCHQFDASMKKHFTVATSTCYACHFMNQPFNANTGACLSCHEPPAGEVAVHAGSQPTTGEAATASQAGTTMDHATIIANNVNCVSCHGDLLYGTGQVTRRDCQNCHDQARYLRDFDQLTIEVVGDYHRVHAAAQRARCNDCHEVIAHELTPMAGPHEALALLSPVSRNCDHCHPDHHRAQLKLLLGQGGFLEGAAGVPNPMVGSRANCRACHTQTGADPKGQAVITSTAGSCRGCHGDEYEEIFAGWQESIDARLAEARSLHQTARQQLAKVAPPYQGVQLEADHLLKRAAKNIRLVTVGTGIHNRNFALMLLDQAVLDLEKAHKLLNP